MNNIARQDQKDISTLAKFEHMIKRLTDSQLERLEDRLIQCGKILEKGRAIICNHRATKLWED